jgi:hypothetical protein
MQTIFLIIMYKNMNYNNEIHLVMTQYTLFVLTILHVPL